MVNTVGSLTEEQKSIITGKLLGDGSLRRKLNTLLEINHSYKQKDYVFWQYEKFKNFVGTPPKLRKSGVNRFSYRFTTLSTSELNRFYDEFYSNGSKSIPTALNLNGLSLAIWFMDDGSRDRKSVYLNTQQFNVADQVILLTALNKMQLNASLNKDKCYFRIRLRLESMARFKNLVNPFLIESMRYKLLQ